MPAKNGAQQRNLPAVGVKSGLMQKIYATAGPVSGNEGQQQVHIKQAANGTSMQNIQVAIGQKSGQFEREMPILVSQTAGMKRIIPIKVGDIGAKQPMAKEKGKLVGALCKLLIMRKRGGTLFNLETRNIGWRNVRVSLRP